MPTTFSDLPADVHIAILDQIGDFRTLVSLSQVSRAQASLVAKYVSQERWRCLLAVEHIGRSNAAREAGVTWSDLANQVFNHCAGCRLCKMVLDDIRFQYIYRHQDARVLCRPLSSEEAAETPRIRVIEGLALSEHNRNRFLSGSTAAPLPLFSIWPKDMVESVAIRLSYSAALVMDNNDGWAYEPRNKAILERNNREPTVVSGFLDLKEERCRLDRHVVLSNLFVTTVPLSQVHLIAVWNLDTSISSSMPFVHNGPPNLVNLDGITSYDALHATCSQWREDPWFANLINCVGLQIGSDNHSLEARFVRFPGRYGA